MPSPNKEKAGSTTARCSVTIKQRLEIIDYVQSGHTLMAAVVWATERFKLKKPLSKSAVSKMVKAREKLAAVDEKFLDHKKRISPNVMKHDEKLVEWIRGCEERNLAISGAIVRMMAVIFALVLNIPLEAQCMYSQGWLVKFQQRHGLRFRRHYGEAGSVTQEMIEEGRADMQRRCTQYAPRDIFNMDETAFFYRMAPDGSICFAPSKGSKKDKARITMCVGSNSTGTEKLPLLFIGKSKVPHDLRGHNVEQELGVQYTNSKKGWMTTPLFTVWAEGLNMRMQAEDRQILLLVDNAPSHKVVELSNVTIVMLPKNTTSVLQPMDQGVIHALKSRIQLCKQVHALVQDANGVKTPYKTNLFSALEWGAMAWEDIDSSLIANCWRKAGIVTDLPEQTESPAPSAHSLSAMVNPLTFKERIMAPLYDIYLKK